MKFFRFTAILFLFFASQSSIADQKNNEGVERPPKPSLRLKFENFSSLQLGDKVFSLQNRVYSIMQNSPSVWEGIKYTAPLQAEQNETLKELDERFNSGDREAGYQIAKWQAFSCMGYLKQQYDKSVTNQICELANTLFKELASHGDLRAMETLAKWYESGTYFEKSVYMAAEWYARIMIWAVNRGNKFLAISYLEKVDRLYPKYPDLESYRRKIHSLN